MDIKDDEQKITITRQRKMKMKASSLINFEEKKHARSHSYHLINSICFLPNQNHTESDETKGILK